MARKRDEKTGETFEVPTDLIKPKKRGTDRRTPAEEPTDFTRDPDTKPLGRMGSTVPARDLTGTPFEAPTVPVGRDAVGAAPPPKPTDDELTRPYRPRGRAAEAVRADTGADDQMADPVVGWLVVIAGPGKGRFCPLGHGTNSIGREEGSRVRLDFGDKLISRQNHTTVTYDPRGRKFYLQHGGGTNLTYLADEPVLVPTLLETMQDFTVGETTLRFVPLCGAEFDWQDTEAE